MQNSTYPSFRYTDQSLTLPQPDISSRCNYHHVRIIALVNAHGLLPEAEVEKRKEAREIIQLWLTELAIADKIIYATTIALVIASHAVVVLLQVRVELDAMNPRRQNLAMSLTYCFNYSPFSVWIRPWQRKKVIRTSLLRKTCLKSSRHARLDVNAALVCSASMYLTSSSASGGLILNVRKP